MPFSSIIHSYYKEVINNILRKAPHQNEQGLDNLGRAVRSFLNPAIEHPPATQYRHRFTDLFYRLAARLQLPLPLPEETYPLSSAYENTIRELQQLSKNGFNTYATDEVITRQVFNPQTQKNEAEYISLKENLDTAEKIKAARGEFENIIKSTLLELLTEIACMAESTSNEQKKKQINKILQTIGANKIHSPLSVIAPFLTNAPVSPPTTPPPILCIPVPVSATPPFFLSPRHPNDKLEPPPLARTRSVSI